MEESADKRVNVKRTEEALALKPDIIGTACPFCMTMLEDGLKEKEATDVVKVRDLAEIVLASVE
jgi:Fe-S oxidoreductase